MLTFKRRTRIPKNFLHRCVLRNLQRMKMRFTYFAALTGVDAIVEAGRLVATYSTEDGRAVKL